MTIQTETSRSGPYAGSGTTGPFTVGFRFLDNSHLQVVKTSAAGVDTTLTLTTHYTVSGAGGSTGTVTLVSALAVGEQLTIVRNVPFTQLADYVDNDSFPAESHESALDLLTMQTQQLKGGFDRSLSLAVTASSSVSTKLPAPIASTIIGWSATGDALQNYDSSSLGVSIVSSSWVTQTFDGNGAQTAFVLATDPGSASNIDLSVGGVAQTANVNFSYTSSTKTILFLTGAPPAGTANIAARYGTAVPVGTVGSSGITDSTVTGRAVLTAANASAARSAIGAAGSGVNTDITTLSNVTTINSAGGIAYVPRADVAANSTINLTSVADNIRITGSGSNISLFSVPAGRNIFATFNGTNTLVNGANLTTQTGANITTVSGDSLVLRSTAANVSEVLFYTPAATNRTLQKLNFTDAGSTISNNTLANLNVSAKSITPKSTNSTIYVRCTFNGKINNVAATNTVGTFSLYEAGAGLIGYQQQISAPSGSGGNGVQNQQTMEWAFPNTTLTAKSFSLQGAASTSAQVSGTNMVWVLEEVQN